MKNKPLVEGKYGHGAIRTNRVKRAVKNTFKLKVAKSGVPFDWTKGYDVRDTIGPIKIKDQGTSDSCGGQAGSYFIEVQRRFTKIFAQAMSAKSIYAPIHYSGGGTTVDDLETQLGARGCETEVQVPSYDANGNPLGEAMMIEQSWITPTIREEMLYYAGYTPLVVGIDIDTIASAVQAYNGVIIEIIGENNGTWLSTNPMPPQGKSGLWAHFLYVCGAKMYNGKKCLIVMNSWGTSVGENGVQYIGEEYVNTKTIPAAFTMIADSHIVSLPPELSAWQWLLLFFKKLFI